MYKLPFMILVGRVIDGAFEHSIRAYSGRRGC